MMGLAEVRGKEGRMRKSDDIIVQCAKRRVAMMFDHDTLTGIIKDNRYRFVLRDKITAKHVEMAHPNQKFEERVQKNVQKYFFKY